MSHGRPSRTRSTSRRVLLAAVTAAAVLSGCASTVQVEGSSSLGSGPGGTDGLGGTTGTTALPGTTTGGVGTTGGVPGATTGGLATTGTGGSTGATGTSGSATGGTGGATGGVASAVPAKGFGWDEKYVYFGAVTQNDAQQAFASVGADNVDPGDIEGQMNAVVAYVNSRGGILGRQVRLKTFDVATVATATNPEQTGQEVCAHFTQDQPVIAVLSVVTLMDYPNFRACLAKKKVTLWSSTVKISDDRVLSELAPYFLQTIAVSWTRLAPVFVDRLKAQGYFSSWDVRTGAPGTAPVKVGIVTDSTPAG